MGVSYILYRTYRIAVFLITILFLFTLLINTSISEQNHMSAPELGTRQGTYDKTKASEWIETKMEFTFEDPVRLTIFIEFNIHEVFLQEYLGSSQFTADGIRMQYAQEIKSTPVNPPIQLALKQEVSELIERLLNHSYPGMLYILENPILDISSLQYPVDEDLYNPPIRLTQYCSYLELNKNSFFSKAEQEKYRIKDLEDLIEGTLKMGGTVTQDIKLYANAGHKNTYIFKVKDLITRSGSPGTRQHPELVHDQLLIYHVDSDTKPPEKDMVEFTCDNLNGDTYKSDTINKMELFAKQPNRMIKEQIKIDFKLNLKDFDKLEIWSSKVSINTIQLDQKKIELPSNFTNLNIISSDGIRLFYDNGIINLSKLIEQLDNELGKIENEFKKALNTSQPIELMISWDQNTIGNLSILYFLDDTNTMYRMGSERPVVGYLYAKDAIEIGLIENASTDLIKGLLNAGARAELDISIKTKYIYQYNLTLPAGFMLNGQVAKMLGSDGRYSYQLSSQDSRDIVISSTHAPKYQTSKASINVEIDLHEIEILSFNEYKGHIKIKAQGSLQHLKMEPNSRFVKALPKDMNMVYFNSDALRLIYSEDLLDFKEYEDEMYTVIKENISKMLDEDLKMHVDFNKERLEFDGDVDIMDDGKPINFKIEASGQMLITENRMMEMGGLITKQISLPITGLKNWNVTYIFILPKYIDVMGNAWVEETEIEYSGPRVEKNLDGRYELSITINGETEDGTTGSTSASSSTDDEDRGLEMQVNMDVDITIWFFLNKIVIPIILFILLLILIIVLISARYRKNRKIKMLKGRLGMDIDDEEILKLNTEHNDEPPEYFSTPKKSRFGERFKTVSFSRSRHYSDGSEVNYSEQLRELMPGKHQYQRMDNKDGTIGKDKVKYNRRRR